MHINSAPGELTAALVIGAASIAGAVTPAVPFLVASGVLAVVRHGVSRARSG